MPARVSTGAIIAALTAERGLIYRAARALKCSPDTIYRRAQDDPRVKATIEHCRGELVDTAEARLGDAVDSGEPWAVALVLKTLGRVRGYIERPDDTPGDDDRRPDKISVVYTNEEVRALSPAALLHQLCTGAALQVPHVDALPDGTRREVSRLLTRALELLAPVVANDPTLPGDYRLIGDSAGRGALLPAVKRHDCTETCTINIGDPLRLTDTSGRIGAV